MRPTKSRRSIPKKHPQAPSGAMLRHHSYRSPAAAEDLAEQPALFGIAEQVAEAELGLRPQCRRSVEDRDKGRASRPVQESQSLSEPMTCSLPPAAPHSLVLSTELSRQAKVRHNIILNLRLPYRGNVGYTADTRGNIPSLVGRLWRAARKRNLRRAHRTPG
eukprot:SAG11_NODE_2740_length_3022_cov_2.199795_4_plen_162_part_00